ncbi:MAG: carboxymuconolactone decarboxylase family protein [Chloroflexi bacterium]|nr:carboxymuconolactone decarboxylase family protein [Chloroflexota bacterium]
MVRRIPIVTREQVPEAQKAAYDEVAGIRGRPPVVGPSSVMIHSPEMAVRVGRLSAYLVEESDLSEKVKRLGAMIAARSIDCQYVWNAHAAAGRRAGLDDGLVDALRDKKPLPMMDPDIAASVEFGLELTGTNKVSQKTFDAAVGQLGVRGLTEFTTLIGYYRMIGLNANACTIDLPEERTEQLLPV